MTHISDPIGRALQDAVRDGVFPGAVLMARLRGALAYQQAVGLLSAHPTSAAVSLGTVYDLASLTKPLATSTAVLTLVQQRRLSLDQTAQELLQELEGSPIGRATVFNLLTHSSGLPGWRAFYERIAEMDAHRPGFLGSSDASEAVVGFIRDEALLYPIGQKSLYSDLGFMLLGAIVQRLSEESLAPFCHERIYQPIGAEALGFLAINPSGLKRKDVFGGSRPVAPTGEDSWRGRVLQGEVHDDNAYAMGGVAGHAGLFGNAEAVLAVSRAWLNAYLGRPAIFSADVVRQFVSRQGCIPHSSWALGWDTPSVPSSSGSRLSSRSFGHLGYTGTSLWVDPTCELEVVLLSNRVHPTRRNEKIKQFRPLIHDLAYRELVGDCSGSSA